MKAIRILHCIPTMETGGAERQLALLAEAQHARGRKVHVLLMRRGSNLDRLSRGGVPVHQIPARPRHDPRHLLDIIRIAKQTGATIVQTWLPRMDIVGGVAARVLGLRWVIAERSSALAYSDRLVDRFLRVQVGRRADAVVANSDAGLHYWKERRHRGYLGTIPNALPLDEIAAAKAANPESLGLSPNSPLIVYVGRMSPEKRLDILLDTLEITCAGGASVACLCGDGPLSDWVRREITRRNLDAYVKLFGFRSDIWSIMKSARAFVNLSNFEGHPNTVLEALACAVPVIVSDIPAHREFLDDTTASFVKPDARCVAEAVQSIVRNPALSKARGAAGLTIARRYSVDAAVRAYDRVYERIAEAR